MSSPSRRHDFELRSGHVQHRGGGHFDRDAGGGVVQFRGEHHLHDQRDARGGLPTAGNNTLNLTAVPVAGTEALSFFNGAAGYNVTFAPSGSSAISDPVETATVSGNTVSLSLASPLVAGDILTVTALGTNPAASTTAQANAIDVGVGNAPPQLTSTITFGTSASGVTVSLSTTAAGTAATYTVGFRASTAVGVGGDIVLSETAGPTNFSTATSAEVQDSTQGWTYAASACQP